MCRRSAGSPLAASPLALLLPLFMCCLGSVPLRCRSPFSLHRCRRRSDSSCFSCVFCHPFPPFCPLRVFFFPVVFLLWSLSPVTLSRVCSASRQHFPSSYPTLIFKHLDLYYFSPTVVVFSSQWTRVSAVIKLSEEETRYSSLVLGLLNSSRVLLSVACREEETKWFSSKVFKR